MCSPPLLPILLFLLLSASGTAWDDTLVHWCGTHIAGSPLSNSCAANQDVCLTRGDCQGANCPSTDAMWFSKQIDTTDPSYGPCCDKQHSGGDACLCGASSASARVIRPHGCKLTTFDGERDFKRAVLTGLDLTECKDLCLDYPACFGVNYLHANSAPSAFGPTCQILAPKNAWPLSPNPNTHSSHDDTLAVHSSATNQHASSTLDDASVPTYTVFPTPTVAALNVPEEVAHHWNAFRRCTPCTVTGSNVIAGTTIGDSVTLSSENLLFKAVFDFSDTGREANGASPEIQVSSANLASNPTILTPLTPAALGTTALWSRSVPPQCNTGEPFIPCAEYMLNCVIYRASCAPVLTPDPTTPATSKSNLRTQIQLWDYYKGNEQVLPLENGGPIVGWDTSRLTDFSHAFEGYSTFNEDISQWDVSAGLNFKSMFSHATAFNQDLSSWNVAAATNMKEMFFHASSFTLLLTGSTWRERATSGMCLTTDMFLESGPGAGIQFAPTMTDATTCCEHSASGESEIKRAVKFCLCQGNDGCSADYAAVEMVTPVSTIWHRGNGDCSSNADTGMYVPDQSPSTDQVNPSRSKGGGIDKWDMSSVTGKLRLLFYMAKAFNGDVSSWDVSGVVNMYGMFEVAESFNIDVSAWDVSSTDGFQKMFKKAKSFNQDLSSWDVSAAWDPSDPVASQSMSFTGMFADSLPSQSPKVVVCGPTWPASDILSVDTIFRLLSAEGTGVGQGSACWHAPSTYTTFIDSIRLCVGTCTEETHSDTGVTFCQPPPPGGGDWYDSVGTAACSVSGPHNMKDWGVFSVTSMAHAFHNARALTSDLSKWNTANVTDMRFAFANAYAFTSDLSGWDVSRVTTAKSMFNQARNFGADLSHWDTSSVTAMQSMFRKNQVLVDGGIGDWDVSSVKYMNGMFEQTVVFNADLGLWDISSAQQVPKMFFGALSFNTSVSAWDIGSVAQMQHMFDGAVAFDSLFLADLCELSWPAARAPGMFRQNETCHPCSAGKWSSNATITSDSQCDLCPTGSWSNATGLSSESQCIACEAGTSGNASEPAGKTSPEDACSLCPKGRYSDAPGSASCEICGLAKYNPFEGHDVDCFPCPSAREEGATECGCNPGTFENDTGQCQSCEAGFYTSLPGRRECEDCPIGYFSDSDKAIRCKSCDRGRFGTNTACSNSTCCAPCEAGRFSDSTAAVACTGCPAGRWSDSQRLQRMADCKLCGPGRHGSTIDGADSEVSCLACADGKFSALVGSFGEEQTCSKCPKGFAQPETGSAYCLPCIPGRFQDVNGSSICDECAADTFAGLPAAKICTDCVAGKKSVAGSATCESCAAGEFGTESSSSCIKCPVGWFRSGSDDDASRCIRCAAGEQTSKDGAAECGKCDLGTFGAGPGVCEDCPAGWYQDGKGEERCNACPVDTFSVATRRTSVSECTACTSDRTTSGLTGRWEIEQCVCRGSIGSGGGAGVGLYTDSETEECMDCPRGAVCLFDGSTLERTYAGEGFWQPDNVTREYLECAAVFNNRKLAAAASLRCCSSTARCNATLPRSESWSPDAQCEDGYAGPLCVLCADNFVLYDNECISCDGGSPLWVGVVGLLGVGGGIFFVSVIMLKKTTTRKDSTHETRATRITGIASIIISWLQILSALTVTYKMAWPSSFVTYSQASGSVVNMEILSLLAIGNCALAVPFLNKFLLQLLTPPIFVAAVILAYFCVSGFRCRAKGAQIDQTNGARLDKTVNLAVIIMQLLYPKLATRTFQMLRCQDLGPSVGMLLESDYSVTCHEGLHDQFVSLAVLSILGYLIGVPLATFVVLWRNRERLHMKDVESRFGDLYRPYEDKWAFWEVILMLQKCMLTGAMCAIAPGSPLQLFIAMGICAMYLLLLTFARPYKGLLEDQLAFMTSLVLTVSLCLGFALNTDAVDPEERVFSIDLCGWVLIILNIMPFVYVIFASVQVLRHGPDFLIDGQGAATATGRPAEKGLPQKDSSNAVEKKKNRVLVRPVPGRSDEETDASVKAEGKENTYGEEDIIHWGRSPRPAADGNSGWGDFPEVASDGGSGTSPATVSTS